MIIMTNFILGMLLMWWIFGELICIGDEYLKQKCNWDDWWTVIICFPAIIIQIPFGIINLIIKVIKKCFCKKSKSK